MRRVCFLVPALSPRWCGSGLLGVGGVAGTVIPCSAFSIIGLSVFVYPCWNVMKQSALWSGINVITICVIIWELDTTSHPTHWKRETWLRFCSLNILSEVGERGLRMPVEACDRGLWLGECERTKSQMQPLATTWHWQTSCLVIKNQKKTSTLGVGNFFPEWEMRKKG